MPAPSWKTGSKHTAISSTSGCSAMGNELSNSQSSGRTVGSSTGGGNWLVNTFSLFFMGPEWQRGMSLFYLEHPRVESGGLKLLGVKRFGMIEVNQFICWLCVMWGGRVERRQFDQARPRVVESQRRGWPVSCDKLDSLCDRFFHQKKKKKKKTANKCKERQFCHFGIVLPRQALWHLPWKWNGG